MIRLKNLDCKLKYIILDISERFRQCMKEVALYHEVCPFCGASGTCHKRGTYKRSLVILSGGIPEVICLSIQRVQCSCGKSHALLPDFIIPYLSYSLPMVLQVLHDYFNRCLTLQQLCDKYLISIPVLFRLKKQFLSHKKEWLGIIRDMEVDGSEFIGELLEAPYAGFHDRFVRKTTYSFLQSHQNPANCRCPRFRTKTG